MEKNDMNSKKSRKGAQRLRLILLVGVLIFITVMGILHQTATASRPAGVDALCPFGGLESLFTVIFSGTMLAKIAVSSFVLLIATVVLAIIFRRTFCGNICALGTLQELMGRLGKKLFSKRLMIPAPVDRVGRYLKYVSLVLLTFFSFQLGELFIRPADPWVAYQHLLSDELFSEFLIGLIVLVVSLGGSLVYDRFFCKYLCPMGGFLGLISKIGLFKIKRNQNSCTSCKACDKACPVNIKVSEKESVTSAECLSCNECVNSCPVKDTLVVEGPGKKRITPKMVLLGTFLTFFIVVGTATATNNFEWFQQSLSEAADQGQAFDPATIKGWMTFEDVSKASGVAEKAIIEKFGIKTEEFKMTIKKIHGKYDFDTQELRDFIGEQMNLK